MKRISALVTTTVAVSLMSAVVTAAEPGGIPKAALDALQSCIGQWVQEDFENGEKIGTTTFEAAWAPGKHCVTANGTAVSKGITRDFTTIDGWEPKGNQLVEHYYTSDGMYMAIRYPLSEIRNGVYQGTATVHLSNGASLEGKCRLEITNTGFVFTSTSDQDGHKVVVKSVAQKAK